MTIHCTCNANRDKIAAEADCYRVAGTGWSPEIIRMLLKMTGSHFPPKISNGTYAINELALARMLRSSNDRTLVAKALEGVGEDYIASVGYCAACQRPLPEPRPKRETKEERLARYHQEITSVLLQHPQVAAATVSVWQDQPGYGLAIRGTKPKTAFKATLQLHDGSEEQLTMPRPSRRTNKGLPPTIYEYQSKNILWTRIKNQKYGNKPYDHDAHCFKTAKDRSAYEQEVKQQYAIVRNINPSCLEVRLLTAADVVPTAQADFIKVCSSRLRYYCEVITRAPGIPGNSPGPILNLEHVSLRNLQERTENRSALAAIHARFYRIQQRFVQPVADFEWWREKDTGDRLRRKIGFRVGAGERDVMYAQEVHKDLRQLAEGRRFFGEIVAATGYLSLVEICDQQTGQLELKWCLSKDCCKLDSDGRVLPHDLNNLYSVVTRYYGYAGTPEQIRQGRKWHFLVQRVLAYCHGSYETMQKLDTLLKQQTVAYRCDPGERGSMTEFREYGSMAICLDLFRQAAAQEGVDCVQPQPIDIDWEQLKGPNRVSQEEWFQGVCKSEVPVDQPAYAC